MGLFILRSMEISDFGSTVTVKLVYSAIQGNKSHDFFHRLTWFIACVHLHHDIQFPIKLFIGDSLADFISEFC